MRGKWQLAAAVIAVVAFALVMVRVVGVARDDDPARLGTVEGESARYEVAYRVWGSGTANEPVEISYTTGDGGTRKAAVPGYAPVWEQSVTTERDLQNVLVTATGTSSDLAFTLTCTVEIDGVELARQSGLFACNAWFELSEAPAALARATRPPTPTTVTATAAPEPPSPPAPPPACRYVTAAELTELVSRAADTVKPVLSVSAKGNRCTEVVDREASRVTFGVEHDSWVRGLGTVRIPELKERAYYLSLGALLGQLRVALPGGDVFVVEVFFVGLRVDVRRIAVETYRIARPRLLRER